MSGGILDFNVKHSLRAYEAHLLRQKERIAAAVRAMNRAMSTARTEISRELAQLYGLKVGEVRSRIRLDRATRTNMVARLTFSGRRIQLYGRFGMRPRGKWGVGFRKLPWRLETIDGDPVSPAMLERAFRQRAVGGRASVFSRHTRHRQSFEVLVAPGLARAMDELRLGPKVMRTARRRWAIVYEQEIKYRLALQKKVSA